VVDGGKARVILSALVTPASIMDNTHMLDLVKYVCSKWKLQPKQATGDAKYGRPDPEGLRLPPLPGHPLAAGYTARGTHMTNLQSGGVCFNNP
jgi:hypothetical protein